MKKKENINIEQLGHIDIRFSIPIFLDRPDLPKFYIYTGCFATRPTNVEG